MYAVSDITAILGWLTAKVRKGTTKRYYIIKLPFRIRERGVREVLKKHLFVVKLPKYKLIISGQIKYTGGWAYISIPDSVIEEREDLKQACESWERVSAKLLYPVALEELLSNYLCV